VLIDDDPDYLSVAPDGSFAPPILDRSGSGVRDRVIESAGAGRAVQPTDVFAAFAEAARAGRPPGPTAADDLMDAAGIAPDKPSGWDQYGRG
jgi:hypothetical protein